MIEARKLCFSYKSRQVLQNVSFRTDARLTAVIGPNAAGKTTFIKCLAGMLRPDGAILIQDKPVVKWKKSELNKLLGYLPQQTDGKTLLTVFEAVLLGRLSRLSWRVDDKDLDISLNVLRELGLDHLSPRPLNELSGGQQQMVSIAQALVKQPRILLMDEPTNSLDLHRQLEVFELITRLTREKQLTSIMALHDLNFAARFADQLIVLHQGQVQAMGPPTKVLSESLLLNVYGVEAKVVHDDTGIPQIIPIRAARPHHTETRAVPTSASSTVFPKKIPDQSVNVRGEI